MLNVESTSRILKRGSVISTRFNSGGPWIYNVVCSTQNNMMDILLIEKYVEQLIFKGCNITIKYNNNYYEYLFEGVIADIKTSPLQCINIKVNKVDEKVNVRNFPRYDTHIPAGIAHLWNRSESYCVITNISLSGISFASEFEFDNNEECLLSIHLPSNTVQAKGKILRKVSKNTFYEYGVAFTDMTEENNQHISAYLLSLEQSIASLSELLPKE